MKIVDNYKQAIENGDEALLKEVFAPQVRFDTPSADKKILRSETRMEFL